MATNNMRQRSDAAADADGPYYGEDNEIKQEDDDIIPGEGHTDGHSNSNISQHSQPTTQAEAEGVDDDETENSALEEVEAEELDESGDISQSQSNVTARAQSAADNSQAKVHAADGMVVDEDERPETDTEEATVLLPKPEESEFVPSQLNGKAAAHIDELILLPEQPDEPRHSSGDSETDGGPANDLMDVDDDIEFVDIGDELRAFNIDIAIPPKPDIITHLQKTFQYERLIIDKMVMTNFKSFGGQHCVGHFHPRFVIVNGPNGCGKSNVIDGLLFVFGYRSKRLRVERVSELIYNNPDTAHQPDECMVEVHMKLIRQKGTDVFEDVPGKNVRVARVGRRNGTSDYILNGSETTQKLVVERLKTYGIDMDHHRFLILQGEVEQIALMPPKAKNEHEEGFLEYLEDIIGTSRLHEPMEKLQTFLEEFKKDYEIKAKDQMLKRTEVLSLEHKRREAELIMLANNAIFFKRYQLKLLGLRAENVKLVEAQNSKLKAKVERDAVAAELQQSDAIREELRGACKSEQAKLDANKTQEKDMESERNGVASIITKIAVDFEHAQTSKNKLEKEVAGLKKQLDEVDTLPQRLEAEIAALDEKRPELEAKVMEANDHYAHIMENTKNTVAKLQAERQELLNKRQPIQQQHDDKETERNIKVQAHARTLKTYKNAKTQLDALQAEQTQVEKELGSMAEELTTIDESIAMKAQLLQDRLQARARCRDDIEKLDKEKNEKLDKLQAAQQQQQQSTRATDTKEMKMLMQAQATGQLQGIIGRLGDLAGIDEKYDVAICSVMQNTLNSVVVQNSGAGRACIAYLKERVGGRDITFIDIEKKWEQNSRNMQQPYNDNVDALRLFDLLQIEDEKVRAVYYSYVRDTLVADDTKQAQSLAFGGARRRRVVTLQGAVIEPSGSMVGGGKPLRGLIGREARVRVNRDSGRVDPPVNLAALQQELDDISNALQAEHSKLATINNVGGIMAEELKELKKRKTDIPVRQDEKQARSAGLPELIAQAQLEVDKHAPNEVEEEDFRLEIEAYKTELDEFKRQCLVIKRDIDRLEREIQNESVGAAQQAKAALDDAKNALTENEKTLSKKQAKLRSSGQQRDVLTKQIAKKIATISEKDAALADLSEKRREATQALETVDAAIQTLKADGLVLLDAVHKARRALDAHVNNQLIHQQRLETLEIELVSLQKDISSVKKAVEKINHETQVIITHIVELGPPSAVRNAEFLRRDFSEEELDKLDADAIRKSIEKREKALHERKTNPNDAQRVLNQYRERHDVWLEAVTRAKEVETKRKKCEQMHRKLQNMRFEEFFSAFSTINNELKWIFRKLTTGGNAALSVADDLLFYENGIDFKVQPLMKPWREISHLSGGEKTLSSLSLIFALHRYRPTPFYILDEIDAALDHRNVTLVGLFVKLQATAGQFIVVSHRPEMIVKADRIIGVTKPGGQSCSVSVTCDLDQTIPIEDLIAIDKQEKKEKKGNRKKKRNNKPSERGTQQKRRANAPSLGIDREEDDANDSVLTSSFQVAATDSGEPDTSSSSVLATLQSTMNLHERFYEIRREQQALLTRGNNAIAQRAPTSSPILLPSKQHLSTAQTPLQQQNLSAPQSSATTVVRMPREKTLAEIAGTPSEARTPQEAQRISPLEKIVSPPVVADDADSSPTVTATEPPPPVRLAESSAQHKRQLAFDSVPVVNKRLFSGAQSDIGVDSADSVVAGSVCSNRSTRKRSRKRKGGKKSSTSAEPLENIKLNQRPSEQQQSRLDDLMESLSDESNT